MKTFSEVKFDIIIKTVFGLEEVLIGELKSLGIEKAEILNRAVQFRGNWRDVYNCNFNLRTALRVLIPIENFYAREPERIYKVASKIDWSEFMDLSQTFAIDSFAHSKYFTHAKYASLVVKDAISDQFTNRFGKRPSVDTDNPDVRINLHISHDQCSLALDSSGDSLHKRGYRLEKNEAPLNEVLAAGMLILSGWDKKIPFLDPMCGSGTIPIEAALLAKNYAPGLLKQNYGFSNWKNFDQELFSTIKEKAIAEINLKVPEIYGSDLDSESIDISVSNSKRAELNDLIQYEVKDFFTGESGDKKFHIVTNPPYGMRLQKDDIIKFYKGIGDTLKFNYPGSIAWVLSGNKEAFKFVGLRPSKKMKLFNGPLECGFNQYQLYQGSRKHSPDIQD
ncbi:MAG: class I SAM-dependent RNA methyltransferase [Melioribacteraceae bacterium]|nr:class I SAM-dependent RNA methyltransferase [Melioribacteraceae bacterium]MCF8265447.1 class I SAM-dependent RNA methyltransferase [Melioribacteraceae bacterium]MCF8413552.1 class I SAM-dependent RNA methyltransferase [Melioribacteraceae bacterium]MCF8431386.1 class I SAM-dependent RNA methyltransferase [Melioribacteraceae bacterium]